MAEETILTFAADIVSAHVSNNPVSAADLPGLIQAVYSSLADLGKPAPIIDAKREPAVSIRASVKPEAITCLECGQKLKMLKRHLSTDHNLTPAEYKARWGLNADYPLVAPDYSAKRKELAMKIGLGRKLGWRKAAAAPVAVAVKPKAPRRKKLGVAFESVGPAADATPGRG